MKNNKSDYTYLLIRYQLEYMGCVLNTNMNKYAFKSKTIVFAITFYFEVSWVNFCFYIIIDMHLHIIVVNLTVIYHLENKYYRLV